MNILRSTLNNEEICIIDTGLVTNNEKELHMALKDAILTLNKGFFKVNTFYPIRINNTVLTVWINNKNFIHFYMGKYHMAFNSKSKLIEKDILWPSDSIKLVDEIIEDNKKLQLDGYFN